MRTRAACHVHSEWSYDGRWSIGDLGTEFLRRGYRIVMMTEHDRGFTESRRLQHREACARASSEQILVLPGIEYSDPTNTVHILVWGDVPFVGEAVPTKMVLSAVKAANGVAVLAHPARRNAWRVFDPAWTELLLGIEIWNRKTDGWSPSRTALPLLRRTGLRPFAGMDFHDRRQFFPLCMSLDVSVCVTETTVLDALRNRKFDATAFGVRIDAASATLVYGALQLPEFARRTMAGVIRRFTARRAIVSQSHAPVAASSITRPE